MSSKNPSHLSIQSVDLSSLGASVSFATCPHNEYFVYILNPPVSPAIVKNGLAFGVQTSDEFPLWSYQALSFKDPEKYVTNPSPRYWLLWPGVLIMLLYSFADVMISLGSILISEFFC